MGEQDRRIFPRFNLQVDVSFRVLDDEGRKSAEARNISTGGVCIISYQPLEVSELLELDIELPEGSRLHVTGRVAWVRDFSIGDPGQGKRFDVGVEFVEVDETTMGILTTYLYTRTPQ